MNRHGLQFAGSTSNCSSGVVVSNHTSAASKGNHDDYAPYDEQDIEHDQDHGDDSEE